MKLKCAADHSVATGTSLTGYVNVSYDRLVASFGPPNGYADRYKTDAEWVLISEDGDPVTIYNYKDGVAYNGPEEGLAVELIRDWHVGGKGDFDAVGAVLRSLA